MALRRTLSLRSLFTTRCYQPSYRCIIRPDNDHHEEKPSYGSFLHQRSFSSSVLSQAQHLGRSSSQLSPFGVSIFRSLSTSRVPGSDESGHVAGTPLDPVMENVAPQALSDSSIHSDLVQWLIETVHSFTGLEMCASILLTTFLIRGMTIPLMISQYRGWSRTMKLGVHSTACAEILDQGGDPAALARHEIEFDKLEKEYGGVVFLSPLFFPLLQLPALMLFSNAFMHVIRCPGVKKHLGIPEVSHQEHAKVALRSLRMISKR